MTTWGDIQAALDGVSLVRHAVLTCSGTWAPPGVGYPSDVVNGLSLFVNDGLCYEVPVQAPWSFGPVGGGAISSQSYAQSVATAVSWATAWIQSHPTQTFAIGGYSQGGEAASRIACAVMTGDLQDFKQNFIGGYTFGNPWRLLGQTAPNYPDPGGHGIAPENMTAADILHVNGHLAWADYANKGDLYTTATGAPGVIESEVYSMATQLELNDFGSLVRAEINGALQVLNSLIPGGLTSVLKIGMAGLAAMSAGGAAAVLTSVLTGSSSAIPGVVAAVEAAVRGLQFIAASPPTGPHISYEGENGYPNAVALAVGHLQNIATLTPARA